MDKDLSNILSYFGLKLKIENDEIHIYDNNNAECEVYRVTEPSLIPEKTNNKDLIFDKLTKFCNIHVVPKITSNLDSETVYVFSLWYHNNIPCINAEKHERINHDDNQIKITEISVNESLYLYNNNGFIKEFLNGKCTYSYIVEQTEKNLAYIDYDNQGIFNIQFLNDGAYISTHNNKLTYKPAIMDVFGQSELFKKMLNDYFPDLNEKYNALRNDEIKYSVLDLQPSSGIER